MMRSSIGWLLSLFLTSSSLKAEPVPAGFVTRDGNRLMLDGQSFYFSGTNQYYFFFKSRQMVDDVLTSANALGLNTLRTWAFCDGEWHDGHSLQPAPGVYNEETFKNLDYAIARAEELGQRLVLSLVNNWDEFGGMNAYVRWAKSARTHDDFYSNPETRSIFRNYISHVLNRKNTLTGRLYKDEPAILMWELANEPRIARERSRELYAWIEEMAAHIKAIDPHHLVSTGSEGDLASDLALTHASPYIDLVSFHLYPETWGFSREKSLSYINKHIKVAKEDLRKPVFCGEFGIRDKNLRNTIYKEWYDTFKTKGMDGSLFWLLSGRRDDGSLYPDYDGFTIYYPQSRDTIPLIQDHARWAQQSSGTELDRTPPHLTIDPWPHDQAAFGRIQLSGTVTDNGTVAEVTVNLGGVERAAILTRGTWRFEWDSREAFDGIANLKVTAKDLEGNRTIQTLQLKVQNQSPPSTDWIITGHKEQDDGFNLVYHLTATNQSPVRQEGRFTVRLYLRPEGTLRIGPHYDQSQIYQGHPTATDLKPYLGGLSYVDIDLGRRSLEPGQFLALKGQWTEPEGSMRTADDWSLANIPTQSGAVQKILWYKDGERVAGIHP